MAKVTTVTHVCDGCGKTVERAKDLHRFVIEEQGSSRVTIALVKTDLCADCEKLLHEALKTVLPADEYAKIEGVVR